MPLWQNSKHPVAQALIAWLLPRRLATGWPVDGITELAMRELGSSTTPRLSDSDVMQVLNELHRTQDPSLEGFEKAVQALITNRRASPRPARTNWTFFFPLKITLADSVLKAARLRVLNRTFFLVPKMAVQRRVGKKTLNQQTLRFLLLGVREQVVIPQTFLVVNQPGSSPDEAWRLLTPAFDTARGLIEFCLGYGTFRITTEPRSRANCPHPDWMLIRAPGHPTEGQRFITEPTDPRSHLTLTSKHLGLIHSVGKPLRREPSTESTDALITDALRLYAQAMDERFDHACMLGLWQLAETLALSERTGGRTDEVCRRLAWHGARLGIPGPGLENLLDSLADRRNEIVHRGIREVKQEEVNFMKRVCEIALQWLIRESRNLPTKGHLDAFYRLRTSGDSMLQAFSGAARHIMTNRKRRPRP